MVRQNEQPKLPITRKIDIVNMDNDVVSFWFDQAAAFLW